MCPETSHVVHHAVQHDKLGWSICRQASIPAFDCHDSKAEELRVH